MNSATKNFVLYGWYIYRTLECDADAFLGFCGTQEIERDRDREIKEEEKGERPENLAPCFERRKAWRRRRHSTTEKESM